MRKKTILVLAKMFGRPDIAIASVLLLIVGAAALGPHRTAINILAGIYFVWASLNLLSRLTWRFMPPDARNVFEREWDDAWSTSDGGTGGF